MSNFFKDILEKGDKLEDEFLGPDFQYYNFIKKPAELGVSSRGDLKTLANDVKGIMNYTQLLVSGNGSASSLKGNNPLGNQFFLKTGGQCTDYKTGETQPRYMYVNNIPSDKLPIVSNLAGAKFKNLRGLVPGIMHNMYAINPIKMFGAFMQGNKPVCAEVTLNEINEEGQSSKKSHHVPINELIDLQDNNEIPAGTVTTKMKNALTKSISPKKNNSTEEGFANLCSNCKTYSSEEQEQLLHNHLINQDDETDIFDKLYLTSISILIMYIFYRFMSKMK